MRVEPVVQDWEPLVDSDLAPYLRSLGRPRYAQRPPCVGMTLAGALEALARCAGRCGLEDPLHGPTGTRWRRRCRFAPMRILGIGERSLGAWVQALSSPEMRIVPPSKRSRRSLSAEREY